MTAELRKLMQDVLENGKVEADELRLIRDALYADGKIDRQEADFLVEIHKRVQRVTPAFEDFFYQALKDHLLADGAVDAEETSWLRQMLGRYGRVDEREKKFLRELKGEARDVSPEFQALFAECTR
jgi:hypothetical protein